MFDVVGIGTSGANGNAVPRNWVGHPLVVSSPDKNNPTMYVRLNKPCSSAADFYNKYLAKLNSGQVYFKMFTTFGSNLISSSDPNLKLEDYVSGYAELDPSTSATSGCGVTTVINSQTGNTEYIGYFNLKTVPISKSNIYGKPPVSPIYRGAIESLQANHTNWIYQAVPNSTSAMGQIMNLLGSIPTVFTDISTAFVGFNDYADNGNFIAGYILNGYSTVRLCSPDGKKIGGGVRVKRLELDDRWDNDKNASTNDNSLYGQEYDYTTTDASGNTISSGVSYEPQVGGEECALKTAIDYVNSTPLSSSYHLFVETPVGQNYYPGPSVGYSKVTVSSIGPGEAYKDYVNSGGSSSSIGSTPCSMGEVSVYEFYTPKDFPVIFQQTDKGPYSKPIKIMVPILGLFTSTISRHAQSQGYSIILNDMAGKPKITSQYTGNIISIPDPCNPGGNLIKVTPNQLVSQQEFIYNTVKPYNPNAINELSSNVQVISVDNNYNLQFRTAVLGQTHDFFIDMNENEQQHLSFGLMGNLDWQTYSPPIVSIPLFWFMASYDESFNNMRTVVTNKIINRTGILKKIINKVEQSVITTENLAFDMETGEVLLTKTNNEFEDPVYSFSYKGYWFYKNLGGSYNNFGVNIHFNPTLVSDGTYGTITIPTQGAYFTKGDLVYITASGGSSGLYHVFKTDVTNPNEVITCIDMNGTYFYPNTQVFNIQVVKSGYKNMLNTNVGSLVFKNTNSSTGNFVAYNPQNPALISAGGTLANSQTYGL